MIQLKSYFVASFLNDFQRWPLWIPVFFGIGISFYFSLSIEPSPGWAYGGIGLFVISLFIVRLTTFRLLLLAIGLTTLGFSNALLRTHFLRTEMLHYALQPLLLDGQVSRVELKPTQRGILYQRILLTDLQAETAEKLPQKIRLTLKGKRERLWPGQRIRVLAKLSPIADPSVPGGFDFRRQAYFNGIGATGFALSIPEILSTSSSWSTDLEKQREKITSFFIQNMSPPLGALAAALITGDKSSIPDTVREDFINSGLAHILAISGLHLSIIAGVIFLLIRRGIALIPFLSLSYNSKKIAAIGTIIMSFLYLMLSGFGVPAQRSFMMISLVMGAILLDRTALSMRTVAFAAFLVLLIIPESLLSPSFQLSFAAVISLIAGYEVWKNPVAHWVAGGSWLHSFLVYSGGLVFTSLLATGATLPFTIYLFHRFSLHAIEANLVAVPLTTLVIMPSALLTCLLTPIGLGTWPLWVLEKSLGLLIQIAALVGSWPGANIGVAQPPLFSFILVVLGSLWLCLWQQPWRRWGVLPIAVGVFGAGWQEPPHLLIDGFGKLVGLYDGKTLYVNSTRRGKFTAEIWKQYLAAQEIKGLICTEGVCRTAYKNIPILISHDQDNQPCEKGAILIRLEPSHTPCTESYLTIDWYDLWRKGGHALWLGLTMYHVKQVNTLQGHRPWTRRAVPRKERPK
ncbi:MAG: ComEC family competence protein [Alphaproteobacteria bacterium]|nr:ComEC family competence protein [Alphaproteobacteria bacterium]